MGLLLRADAEFVTTSDGMWIITNHGAHWIGDPALYRHIHQLRPLLTGGLDRGRILAAAPEADALLGALRDAAALRDSSSSTGTGTGTGGGGGGGGGGDSAEEAFIGYFTGDAATRMAAFRTTRALVVGTGPLASYVARACRIAGLTRLAAVERASDGDAADLLIDVTGLDVLPSAGLSGQALVARAALRPGEAWLAPVCPVADIVPWPELWAVAPPPAGGGGSAATLRIVAGQLAQRVLRRCTMAYDGPAPTTFRRIDLDGLTATEHAVPHPAGGAGNGVRDG